MSVPLRSLFLALGAAVTAGCQGFAPPAEPTLQRLRPMPMAARIPPRFELEIESPQLSGVFDAVFAVGAHGFALQLFPDIGGKVFDLAVGRDRVVADTPAGPYLAEAPLDAAPPHLALVLAAVFAELLAPVDAARVRGERRSASGDSELLLAPALGSGRVVATLADDGTVARYTIELGWLAVTLDATGRVQARGLDLHLRWRQDG
ncbi:MAG: hypothetical protein JNM25_17505 [Planctomycetes bacterium]|nr:hypothetical protein [Planctomycetota bacterium]